LEQQNKTKLSPSPKPAKIDLGIQCPEESNVQGIQCPGIQCLFWPGIQSPEIQCPSTGNLGHNLMT
jgi:hypothetical protein